MRRIQFERMRELTSIYEAYGLRGSFNAEVMQQLHHLEFGARHPELAELAAEWEEVVLDTYRRGHDVQLHVHSQWSDADYRDGRWKLSGNWSILTYPLPVMRRMIGECRSGRNDFSLYIWALFNLIAWYDYWIDGQPA